MKNILIALFALLTFTGCDKRQNNGVEDIKALIGQGQPVMLEVGADYCTACKEMKRLIGVLKNEQPDLAIHMVNVSKSRESAQVLGVRMIPTQIFYDAAGNEVFRHVGGYGETEFRAVLTQYNILKEQ